MKQKINIRLSLIAVIAVISTTIGITFIYYNLFQDQVRKDLRMNAQLLCDTEVFQNLYQEVQDGKTDMDSSALKKLERDSLRITWISQDGTVLYDNDTSANVLSNHQDRPEIKMALKYGDGESVRKSDTMNMNTFYYALKLDDNTVLRVSTQAQTIISVCLAALPVILSISAVILFICIVLGHMLSEQLLKPIEMMAEHLDEPIDTPVYKELEPFADKIRVQHENILSAAKVRQDFTANVSHELKTPLTAISGYAELIENHMIPENQAGIIAESIRRNAERLLSLINDIIRLSELDHRELPRQYLPADLHEIAMNCAESLQMNSERKNVRISCEGEPVIITVDRDLMRELISNLAQNAIQYNNPGGYVKITTGTENGHAFLSVSDNGIGIPKDQQERVFERFYRVDKSRSRETGGTGLGLAIVKHIAQLHDAKIRMESEPGKGTSVTVRF